MKLIKRRRDASAQSPSASSSARASARRPSTHANRARRFQLASAALLIAVLSAAAAAAAPEFAAPIAPAQLQAAKAVRATMSFRLTTTRGYRYRIQIKAERPSIKVELGDPGKVTLFPQPTWASVAVTNEIKNRNAPLGVFAQGEMLIVVAWVRIPSSVIPDIIDEQACNTGASSPPLGDCEVPTYVPVTAAVTTGVESSGAATSIAAGKTEVMPRYYPGVTKTTSAYYWYTAYPIAEARKSIWTQVLQAKPSYYTVLAAPGDFGGLFNQFDSSNCAFAGMFAIAAFDAAGRQLAGCQTMFKLDAQVPLGVGRR